MDTDYKFPSEYWDDSESEVTFTPADALEDTTNLTAVKAYIIQDDKLLLTKVGRGWDLPGGHVEEGETALDAIVREVKEETGGNISNPVFIGYLSIKKMKVTEQNKNYPDIGINAVYTTNAISFDETFKLSDFEATEKQFISFAEIENYHHNWTPMKSAVLEYAQKILIKVD